MDSFKKDEDEVDLEKLKQEALKEDDDNTDEVS